MPYLHLMPNDEITAAAAATILRVDVRTVHRMVRRGEIRGHKIYDGLRAPYLVSKRDVLKLADAKDAA